MRALGGTDIRSCTSESKGDNKIHTVTRVKTDRRLEHNIQWLEDNNSLKKRNLMKNLECKKE